ncbi:MAG: hypothetical protein PHF63_12165 [Herbinix sp.]|nr:hypothetical protein [Herbinix sp.]
MAKKILSIVIGDEITKVCEISYRKKYKNEGIRVFKSISFPTPENMIEDGFIKNKDAFCEQLRSQLRLAKMKSKKVIFSISSSKIANREVIIPLVNDNRIMDIINTGANEYFPVDMKDYILSYIILEKKKSDRKEKALAKKQAMLDKKAAKKQEKIDIKAAKKGKGKNAPELVSSTHTSHLLFSEENHVPNTVSETEVKIPKKDQTSKKNKKHIRLSVYAVPSNLVKNYYNFADIMGLNIVSIDYSGNSSYQMLKRQANEGTNVFIQLNEQDTVISILSDNVLILQRTIGYGISTLVETVMEHQCFHVNDEKEAIELLHNKNLLNLNTPEVVTIDFHSKALDEAAAASELISAAEYQSPAQEEYLAKKSIVESLQFLTNSISRMLDYYKNNHKNVIFKSIYLSGFGIRIQGIDQLFSERIGIDNKKLEKLYTVSAKKKAQEYRLNPSEFMACVGSVLKPVDFVPTELAVRKQKIQTVVASSLLLILCLSATAALCYFSYDDYRVAKSEYETAFEQLNALPDTSAVKSEYEQASKRLEDLQKMEAAMQTEDKINEVISELKKNILTNAKIQSIQFSDTGVVMMVIMSDNNYGANTLVAKLLMQIKNIELFETVQDSNMSVSDDGEVSLTISCTYQ